MPEHDYTAALVKAEGANHVVLQTPPAELWEAVRANCGDKGNIITSSAMCIKLGQGGFSVNDVDGEAELKELPGSIIVDWNDLRSYYGRPLEESGGANPDCYSADAVTGVGAPGGICETCKYSQWGSARNVVAQACKKNRILYVLREQNLLPEPLKLPPTSIGAAVDYFVKLSMRGLPHYAVVTCVGTDRVKNAAGIPYLKATFALVHRLPPEQAKLMRDFAMRFRARRLHIRNGGEQPPDWALAE